MVAEEHRPEDVFFTADVCHDRTLTGENGKVPGEIFGERRVVRASPAFAETGHK